MDQQEVEYVSNKVLTVPNIISFIRILLIPVFVLVLLSDQIFGGGSIPGHFLYAFLIFVIASASDGLDGFIARRFNCVSRLGKILDPVADRGLLIFGSIALCILDRLPVWIVVLILIRDFSFLIGGGYLLSKYNIRINVIMLGKIATAIFYVGFALLVIGIPFILHGFDVLSVDWLPGFCYWQSYWGGIWLVYIAIVLNIFTCYHYVKTAILEYKKAKHE